MCEVGGGSGVVVNGGSVAANVTSVSTPPTVLPAPVAVTTFPVQQQQPSFIDPSLLQQYSGNTFTHSLNIFSDVQVLTAT